jgi:predicted acetyltransferase
VTHSVRFLEPDELRTAHTLFASALHQAPAGEQRWSRTAPTYAPGRTLGAHNGTGKLIGTATSFPTRTAVVGGAALPTAAVSRVGVRADHTRRGVLTALLRAQLEDAAERGEMLAALRASEARIYGRFGYGLATRGRNVTVRRHGGSGWRAHAPRGGSVRLLDRAEIADVLTPLHEKIALRRTGGIVRPETWWWRLVQRRVEDNEHLLAAVHSGPDGDDGFFLASAGQHSGSFSQQLMRVEDLHAADLTATAELWRFVLDLDLVGDVEAELRPLDEPLELLLADPRDCRTTTVADETWLRLVDVPGALGARGYGRSGAPVLLAVHDPLLPGNAGVYRFADGHVELAGPLDGPVQPELECDVAGLAMAYLGDRLPSQLAATGWWRVHEGTAVERADAAFATHDTPWCGTFY